MSSTVDKMAQNAPPSSDASLNKAVSIHEEPDQISPSLHSRESPRVHRASLSGRKLSGRPAISSTPSTHSLSRQISSLKLDQVQGVEGVSSTLEDPGALLSKVIEWLYDEKAKQVNRNSRQEDATASQDGDQGQDPNRLARPRSDSRASEGELALDKLERILAGYTAAGRESISGQPGSHRTPFAVLRKSSIGRRFKPTSMTISSDLEQDSELFVPSVEATLDNSKALAYSGGNAESDIDCVANSKDKENWTSFKREIVRLTHTLKLKRWKRVPIESGADISVERLSGALTNAVYVVSPPKRMPEYSPANESGTSSTGLRPPPKLLLRIYGPQVEHLIDRESELSILRRLAKKSIGPRLLGTFKNGRFEEFLYAHTLTPEDMRIPDTSKQIAKRMRELHDGIELLEEERERGPFVWVNWDKWVDRCEQVITWLDHEILRQRYGHTASKKKKPWRSRGLVCGVEWPLFRKTVDKYRRYIIEVHGGTKGIKQQLVFAHNDTQYGNLLRLQPSGESPLLHPKNEHKQLVVIDFEYASANLPGFEFANHFTEWCYNYHHPERAWAINPSYYPTPDEQRRFVRTYVQHRPVMGMADSASTSPKSSPKTGLATAESNPVSSFMLDSRARPDQLQAMRRRKGLGRRQRESQVEALLRDAKLWRGMCSAYWVAWGIVQARIPEMERSTAHKSKSDRLIEKVKSHLRPQSDPLSTHVIAKKEEARRDRPESRAREESHREGDSDEAGAEADDEEAEDDESVEEFDYLAYARDRALFFWGDCLQLDLVKEEELPADLLGQVKTLTY